MKTETHNYKKVSETTLPENVFKCAVCCVMPNKKGCAKFEFENGFDNCDVEGHYYQEVEG
jgi:hypothetical protein